MSAFVRVFFVRFVCDLRFTLSLSLHTLDLHQFLDNTIRRILNPLSDLVSCNVVGPGDCDGGKSAGWLATF